MENQEKKQLSVSDECDEQLNLIQAYSLLEQRFNKRSEELEVANELLLEENRQRKLIEQENHRLIHDLNERIKELTALHRTALIMQDEHKTIPELLKEMVSFLPDAWQYPTVTAVRITYGTLEVTSENFCESEWRQEAYFATSDGEKGAIEVVYLREMPAEAEGPFLKEERSLINSIVEMLRSYLEGWRAAEALSQNEQMSWNVLEAMPMGVWVLNKEGRIVHGNPAGRKIWGGAKYVGMEQFGEYKGWWLSTGKRIEADEWAAARAIRNGETSINEEIKIESFDGISKVILNSAIPIHDAHNEIAGAIIVNEDITEHHKAEEEMKKLSLAIEESYDWVLITDRKGNIEYLNRAVEEISGYTKEELIGKRPNLFKSGMHDVEFYKKMWATMLSGQVFRAILTNRKKDGSLFEVFHSITPLKDSEGKITHFIATAKDVTQQRILEERLNYLAYYDVLTGLPNRSLFTDRLHQLIVRAEHDKNLVAVLAIDIKRFAFINDTFGQGGGDEVLKEAGKRLSSSVREGDTVARFGNDEFEIALGAFLIRKISFC